MPRFAPILAFLSYIGAFLASVPWERVAAGLGSLAMAIYYIRATIREDRAAKRRK